MPPLPPLRPSLRPSTFSYTPHLSLRLAAAIPGATATATGARYKSHHRPSSSAQPSTSSAPSTNATSTHSLANDINPPPSTRPADLALPDPIAPDAGTAAKLTRYVALGRAYLSFYKTGLKNVYHNYRDSVPLRRELGLPAYIPSSPPLASSLRSSTSSNPNRKAIGNENGNGHGIENEKMQSRGGNIFEQTIAQTRISRANLQLTRRAAFDLRRLIPFTLLLIICGEMTPLVLLALGSAVTPRTCRVPGQVAKDRRAYMARIRKALDAESIAQFGSLASTAAAARGKGEAEMAQLKRYAAPQWVEEATPEAVLRACAALGLVKRHDPLRWPVGLWVSGVYRPKLRRYAAYLAVDDMLMLRAGGVSAMEAAEVTLAVEERGGVAVSEGLEGWDAEREERRWLERWLHLSPSSS